MRKNVHIVAQGKGGVGKTFICWLAAQYLRESHGEDGVSFADSDPVNKSFAAFRGLDAISLDLFSEDHRNVEPGDFEKVFEFIQASRRPDILIDTGASNFVPLYTFLSEDQADQMLADTQCNLFMHVPVCGGENRTECLQRLQIMLDNIPNAKFVVWINNYPVTVFPKNRTDDPASREPEKFEETVLFQKYRDRIEGVVPLPHFPDDSTGKTLKLVTKSLLTFAEFEKLGDGASIPKLDGVAITYLQKFRAKQVKARLWGLLKPLFDHLDKFKDDSMSFAVIDHGAAGSEEVYVPGGEAQATGVDGGFEEAAAADEDDYGDGEE